MRHLVKSHCNACLCRRHREWTAKNQERVKEYRGRDTWTLAKRCARRGITPEQLVSAYEAQDGKCAICTTEVPLIDSAIDHNHKTGEFRGVLCKTCNRALGLFQDSETIMASAINYLKTKGSYYHGT